MNEKGSLYLCPTPIGNLEDITLRTLNVLKTVDLVAAEDTRHSLGLLNHFEIKKPLISYHEHNKKARGAELLKKLIDGENIALVTDAGMPAISDPGEDLVKLCIENGVTVVPLPGANAALTALIASGVDTSAFVFQGFLPVNKKERKIILERVKNYPETLIFYEAPHKLKNTLSDFEAFLGNRKLCICRELTKKFEEFKFCTIAEALEVYKETEPRGEYVLIVEGCKNKQIKEDNRTLEEIYNEYIKGGTDFKEAIKLAAKDKNISKREAYEILKK